MSEETIKEVLLWLKAIDDLIVEHNPMFLEVCLNCRRVIGVIGGKRTKIHFDSREKHEGHITLAWSSEEDDISGAIKVLEYLLSEAVKRGE